MPLTKPLVVVSDIHLARDGSPKLSASLARVVRQHPAHEIILNGDAFTLSLDPPDRLAGDSVRGLLADDSELRQAMRDHVLQGGALTFVAGNHDAGLADSRSRNALAAGLELTPDAPVVVSPWFVRRGSVHVEHGHVFDPDNAPTHPLAPWSPSSEPLGVALTRQFLAPSGALMFVHAHETTPLAGFTDVLRSFGPRAPSIIFRYFRTAIGLCVAAGPRGDVELERRTGDALLPAFAANTDVTASALETLLSVRETPTHTDRKSVFMRLYFDRVIATVGGTLGAITFTAGSPAGAAVLLAGAAYVAFSVSRGVNRYGGRVEHELARAAGIIRRETGAELVIFGHTHREESMPGYLNTGSFGYPRDTGRPYVVVAVDGTAEMRRLAV